MPDEKKYQAWIESIEFVDDDDKIIPPVLTDDESDDPEGDRSTDGAK